MNAEDMKKRCLEVARMGCLVPPDGGAPSDEEREVCERIVAGIAAIPVEPDHRNAQILSLRAENRTLRRAIWYTPVMPDLLDRVPLSDVLTYAEVVHRTLTTLTSFQCKLVEAAPPPEGCTTSDQVVAWFVGRLGGYAERHAQVEVLLEALKPFADEADRWDDVPGVIRYEDNVELWQTRQTPISVGHLRRARAAVAAIKNQ